MDTTQDIDRNDQLIQTIRCFSISEDEAGRITNLKINGSFIGFIETSDETGLGLEQS